jgi:alkanesulfonate monooxygenase SsuD/methylene tetrahydromethanopterin reductase-like flavin-dependent oxidoreductase (luciferase family)
MLELAGAYADGVYLNFIPVEALPTAIGAIRTGTEQVGRASMPDIYLSLPCVVTDDPERAREGFRHDLGFYLTAPAYRRALGWYGFKEEVEKAKRASDDGDLARVRAAVSDRLLDGICAFGSVDHCHTRIDQYVKAGVNNISVFVTDQRVRQTLEQLGSRNQLIDGHRPETGVID